MGRQFEETYRLKPAFADNPGNLKKQLFIEETQARIQSALSQRPKNIAYFEEIMYTRDGGSTGRPRVGYFCNMVPHEIIAAMGAEAVRLDCGNNAAAVVGEEVLSGEICPLAKASFGSFLREDSLANTCDLLVLPTSCDAKRKMGEVVNDFKPTFMFNLPPEQNHSLYSRQSYLEVLRLVQFLRKRLRLPLYRRRLAETIELGRERTLLVRELQELRIRKPRALTASDFLLIIQSSQFRPVDLSEWIGEARNVRDEIEAYEPKRRSLRPRLVLTGAPMVWPNFKVLNVFDEAGADIVADTLCTGAQCFFDPIVRNERGKRHMLRALANRYVYASICPCFISQTKRINRILELVEGSQADGVVNYSLRLCQVFDVETYRIEKILKSRKASYINIRTDYSLEDTEQLRVRIEAFLETL